MRGGFKEGDTVFLKTDVYRYDIANPSKKYHDTFINNLPVYTYLSEETDTKKGMVTDKYSAPDRDIIIYTLKDSENIVKRTSNDYNELIHIDDIEKYTKFDEAEYIKKHPKIASVKTATNSVLNIGRSMLGMDKKPLTYAGKRTRRHKPKKTTKRKRTKRSSHLN